MTSGLLTQTWGARLPCGVPRKTKTAAPMLDSITLPELTPGAEHDLRPDAEIEGVGFVDLTLDDLDLGQATLDRVAFRETQVARLDLQGATLEHVDLRGAELREIGGVASMSGATISEQQLVDLAPLLAADRGILVAP